MKEPKTDKELIDMYKSKVDSEIHKDLNIPKDIGSEMYSKFRVKVENKLKKDFNSDQKPLKQITSRQYDEFRNSFLPKNLSWYEKACNVSESLLHMQANPSKVEQTKEDLATCHLNCTPAGITSFAILGPLIFMVVSSIFGFIFPILAGDNDPQAGLFFVMFSIVIGFILMLPLNKFPSFLATSWRMKASNQMVLSIFYVATYMRHTSNLELAIDFAAEHLSPPLSLDLKKVIWDVETQEHSSVKESLEAYLEKWKKYNMEYIESMHLIISSLYETSETRRLNALDKSLEVILEETKDRMMHYAQNLKTPLDTLNMLGIVLPVLGLVILPLMVSFMPQVKWYHLASVYNIALPIIVYYLGKNILATRPSGYGHVDLSHVSEYKKYSNIIIKTSKKEIIISPIYLAALVFILFFLIGTFPLFLHAVAPDFDLVVVSDSNGGVALRNILLVSDKTTIQHSLLGYRFDSESLRNIGPFGLGATLLSLMIPIAFGISLGLYYKLKSKNVMGVREKTRKLEEEFASSLFQLGNRLGDGIPPELAFSKVSQVMTGTISGKFFDLVSLNISKKGMSVEKAIFDKKEGAINFFPSNLIDTSMKILIESSKKGSLIASNALINVSNYIKQMHRVDTRLTDLMTDVVSSMKAQISFLTPIIAGIVIGITSMITTILGSLTTQMNSLSEMGTSSGAGGLSTVSLLSMFNAGVPTYYFQVIVGLYVVQIVFILTIISNGIVNGSDKLNEKYLLGKNMISSTLLYVFIGGVVILIFNLIAGSILSGLSAG